MKNKVSILGTTYKIELVDKSELEPGIAGNCDQEEKIIRVDKDTRQFNAVLRHELIHAFFYESGLGEEVDWVNENSVDWIAIQFPKIAKVITELDIMEG